MIKVPTWETLSRIQRTRHVKSMYIWLFVVPVIANLLSQVDSAANVTIFAYQFIVPLKLPFSWKIFYFSALCFSISNFLYLVRCYSIIKDNRSYSDFEMEGKGKGQLLCYSQEVGVELGTKITESNASDLETSFLKETFWEVFKQANLKRTPERILCGSLCAIGYLLISIVLIQNFYEVLRMAF